MDNKLPNILLNKMELLGIEMQQRDLLTMLDEFFSLLDVMKINTSNMLLVRLIELEMHLVLLHQELVEDRR